MNKRLVEQLIRESQRLRAAALKLIKQSEELLDTSEKITRRFSEIQRKMRKEK